MLLLIFLLIASSVGLGTWAVLRPGDDTVARRARTGSGAPMLAAERRLQPRFSQRVLLPGATRVGSTIGRVLPRNLVSSVNHQLVMADQPMPLPAFLAVWALSAGVGVGLVAYLAVVGSMSATQVMGVSIAIVPFAVLVPYALIRRRAARRRKSIIRALPDALDLLVTSVEAGMGVDAAFATVAERTEGPLSESFGRYLRQVGLGRGRRQALTEVAEQSGVPDLVHLAAAVSQGEDLGTSMGDVLRTQAEDLRVARRQRAQEAAQRAPVLMTIPLALCFLPAMGAVVIVPSILNLIDFIQELGA